MVLIGQVALAVPRGGQEPLPLKVAPIQPSVTAAFHLQSRRDSDCQIWELRVIMCISKPRTSLWLDKYDISKTIIVQHDNIMQQ